MVQEENEALKISATGRESSRAKFFQMRFGMPSGPMDLKGFIFDIFLHTSSGRISGSSFCAGKKAGKFLRSNGARSDVVEI